MGPITRLSERGMKPDVLQSETWHKTGYPDRVRAEVSSFLYLTFTYKRETAERDPFLGTSQS